MFQIFVNGARLRSETLGDSDCDIARGVQVGRFSSQKAYLSP